MIDSKAVIMIQFANQTHILGAARQAAQVHSLSYPDPSHGLTQALLPASAQISVQLCSHADAAASPP